MPETMYHSRLWKSSMLAASSSYFPALVRAAAVFHGKPYTEAMMQEVATNVVLLDALQVKLADTIDYALTQYATDPATAGALDGLILDAVAAYEVPEPLPAA